MKTAAWFPIPPRLSWAVVFMAFTGCGAVDNHITAMTEGLQGSVDNWRVACNAGKAALEANGEDPAELVEACEEGWRAFQLIEEYQKTYCAIRGLICD